MRHITAFRKLLELVQSDETLSEEDRGAMRFLLFEMMHANREILDAEIPTPQPPESAA